MKNDVNGGGCGSSRRTTEAGGWRPRTLLRLWWAAFVIGLTSLLLMPIDAIAFLSLLCAGGAAFALLRQVIRRQRQPLAPRWLSAAALAIAFLALPVTAAVFSELPPPPHAPLSAQVTSASAGTR